MQYITPIISEDGDRLRKILRANALEIRRAFAKMFRYNVEEVVWMPRLLTHKEFVDSQNLLDLEIVVDMGSKEHLGDHDAERFKTEVLRICPELTEVSMRVWLRSMVKNGFANNKLQEDELSGCDN